MSDKICPICSKSLDDKRHNYHFNCMVNKYKQGDRSDQFKKYFTNRGCCMRDVREIADGKWDLH